MKNNSQIFPGKILLFGEYSVIHGGNGVAIPFPAVYAQWKNSNVLDYKLISFLEYLERNHTSFSVISIEKLKTLIGEVKNGLQLYSTIPFGAGLGSSGSLCAAVYSKVKKDTSVTSPMLRNDFRIMENYFHGSSSGLDPLVSFLNAPVQSNGDIITQVKLSLDANHLKAYVYNTKLPRETKPLVQWYTEARMEETFRTKSNKLERINNEIIQTLLDDNLVFEKIAELSALQFEIFKPLIPEIMRPVWERLLSYRGAKMKLCGAGGGGSYLLLVDSRFPFPTEIISISECIAV